MNHKEYSVGITYKEEPNHLYWIKGGSMEGVVCSSCKGNFTMAKCKPTNVKPAYTCMERTKGCEVCYCNNCFSKEIENFLKSESGGRHCRNRKNISQN